MEGLQLLSITTDKEMKESSRSEGAISVSYSTEIPKNIKNRLNAYRRLKAVSNDVKNKNLLFEKNYC